MPEATNPIEQSKNDFSDRLAELGQTFNTNKGFGMMGMLENQEQSASEPSSLTTAADPTPTTPAASTGDSSPPEWFEPLNSSLRAIKEETVQQMNSVRNEIAQLRTPPVIEQLTATGEIDPVAHELNTVKGEMGRMKLNTAYERARNSLNTMKIQHPEFDATEQDLRDVWTKSVGNNVGVAEGTNWDAYWAQEFTKRQEPKLKDRISKLENELAQAKSTRNTVNDLASVPRANRQGLPSPQVSEGAFDEDVYRAASKRMSKGRFSGFNKMLIEEQNRKMLRDAR